MTSLEFLSEAREEFFAAALFYDAHAPKLGHELVVNVLHDGSAQRRTKHSGR